MWCGGVWRQRRNCLMKADGESRLASTGEDLLCAELLGARLLSETGRVNG
jgi:hypothetical protein